jgi:hypothetical protein
MESDNVFTDFDYGRVISIFRPHHKDNRRMEWAVCLCNILLAMVSLGEFSVRQGKGKGDLISGLLRDIEREKKHLRVDFSTPTGRGLGPAMTSVRKRHPAFKGCGLSMKTRYTNIDLKRKR